MKLALVELVCIPPQVYLNHSNRNASTIHIPYTKLQAIQNIVKPFKWNKHLFNALLSFVNGAVLSAHVLPFSLNTNFTLKKKILVSTVFSTITRMNSHFECECGLILSIQFIDRLVFIFSALSLCWVPLEFNFSWCIYKNFKPGTTFEPITTPKDFLQQCPTDHTTYSNIQM